MKKLINSIVLIATLNTATTAQTSESFGGLGISVYPGKKGASVWQKDFGKLPSGSSNVAWGGANLPAGSYHARLEAGGTVLTQKFELR